MAHTCPVCGETCHCNGDIDDICFDFDEDIDNCTHCPVDSDDEWDGFLEDDCNGGNAALADTEALGVKIMDLTARWLLKEELPTMKGRVVNEPLLRTKAR